MKTFVWFATFVYCLLMTCACIGVGTRLLQQHNRWGALGAGLLSLVGDIALLLLYFVRPWK